MPDVREAPWIRKALKFLFPKSWRSLYRGVPLLIGLATLAVKAPEFLEKWRGITTPEVAFVSISPSRDASGIYDVVVVNRSDMPIVMTGIGVQTLKARPSAAESSGQALLPVQEDFDLRLSRVAGQTVVIERAPTQLLPKANERMQVRFSAVSESREAWIDFEVRLSLRAGERVLAQSEPLEVKVFPRLR